MKRNGLVFVPREPPKRVVLYATQDSPSQQPESLQQSNNNNRLSRQPLSLSATHRTTEKPDNDGTAAKVLGQATSANVGQKLQNPYYANPFFRPKVITNQPSTATTTAALGNTNLIPPPSRDSSTVITTVSAQTLPASSATAWTNRNRQPFYPKVPSPQLMNTGRTQDAEPTSVTSTIQDDGRRWAQPVATAPLSRRAISDERPHVGTKLSETDITTAANNDTLKPKGTSATDIVISLMDTWRAPINPNPVSSSAVNIFMRTGGLKDDSALLGQPSTADEQSPGTPSAINNTNQNWKKALVANFQKNSRNMPTAKLFHSKHTTIPPQLPPPVLNNDATLYQQQKNDRTMMFNGGNGERTFQATETTLTIPIIPRKATESLRMTKQENNNNNNNHNIERSTSLQVPASTYSNSIAPTANKPEETPKPIEPSNSENTPSLPIPIPSALITAKPPANVEQQRAIITRVMIRRDFVKSVEPKPPMLTASNIRSFNPPHSAKPGGLPTSNVIQVATIAENSNVTNGNVNPGRAYPPSQPPPYPQSSMPLSQKSLLAFTSNNPTTREPIKTDQTHPQSNSITNDVLTSSSLMKMQQTQIIPSNGANAFRSASSSAANAESRRKREDMFSKAKKRAASASAASNDGMMDKDPFEAEDEEDEAEMEEESVRSSESDAELDNNFSLDPALLLSDKSRRVGNTEVKSGFIPSLFVNVPPTIRFCTENQRIEPLPAPLRKMMKWKMSTITPNIVKNTVIRSGFRLINSDEGSDWLGTWSRHMKPICFKAIREYQKVNHFPGSFQIGRKDRLWRNLSHMQAVHSRREFDFVPQTYVLPADLLLFKRVFEEISDTKECKWIIKPPASARGQGIRVISKMEHVPKKRPVIVQKYIANPYLINGHKFDLRLYVYVTSHDPLRIYLFDDGLARFASRKYSAAVKSLSDRFMHLTNYSINRYNSEYKTNNDSAACTGHKWSLKALWTYLKKRDVDAADVMEKIKDLIVKTIISADSYVNVLTKANVRRKFCVHELFGFDVILDEHCKPYIVEVNISPSLHSNSPLDISVKGAMISDLLNLSGFMIPDRRDILYEGSARRKPKLPKSLIFDRRVLPQGLSTDEKIKHQHFSQRYHDEQARRNILDVLTPDDLRILIESEDEFARRGSFERIFPTNQTRKYLKYFETPRYYNLLLNEWIAKYNRMEERGISLLNTCCKKGIHFQHPAVDANHMWTQYQKLQGHLSHRDNDNSNTNGS